MRELERLDELDRQARRDEVSNRAVDSRTIRANVYRLLRERVRQSSLKMESRSQIIGEAADCRTNHQRAQIAAHRGLGQTLVMVTWDDYFDKRRDCDARRLQELESSPEIEVLKRSMVRAVVEVGRLPFEANCMSTASLVTLLHVGKRRVHGDPVGEAVLDVPEKDVAVRPLSTCSGIGLLCAKSIVLPVCSDRLIRHADGAFTRRGNKGLCRHS